MAKQCSVCFSILFLLTHLADIAYSRQSFPDKTDSKFLNDCLYYHNQVRKAHSVPAMKIDDKLVSYSKTRVKEMSKHEGLKHGHKGLDDKYGENIYTAKGSGQKLLCANAIKAWYREANEYNFARGVFSKKTGHFTQLVWKDTVKLGCARGYITKNANSYETYIVCNYVYPGNVQGSFIKNVRKPRSKKPVLRELDESLDPNESTSEGTQNDNKPTANKTVEEAPTYQVNEPIERFPDGIPITGMNQRNRHFLKALIRQDQQQYNTNIRPISQGGPISQGVPIFPVVVHFCPEN